MTGRRNPTIVVLGMATRHPVPGVIWQTIHYLLGFKLLGYEVYYVEAHGRPPHMFMEHPELDSSGLAFAFIQRVLNRFGLGDRWAFHALHEDGRVYGMSIEALYRLYRRADLIINLHAGTVPRPEHHETGRLICLETDPVRVQIELSVNDRDAINFLEPHSAFFTFAENYGSPSCGLPTSELFDYRPTRQPVVLSLWGNRKQSPSGSFRTIANWRQLKDVFFRGETYSWSKHHEFLKFIDLPDLTGQQFEAALAKIDAGHTELLQRKGWRLRDALAFGEDIDAYRDFIQAARGEFSVAKDQNIRLRTGWFSDRSATFLASGLPVIVQDTAFGRVLPVGEGLLPFLTLDEAVDAVQRVCADPGHHERAAAEIAREYFSHEVVLGRLLSDLGMPDGRPTSGKSAGGGALPDSLEINPPLRHSNELDESVVTTLLSRPIPDALSARPVATANSAQASVVVVTRDNLPFTRMCLECLLQDEASPPHEVIVIDNASEAPTQQYLSALQEQQPCVRVVFNRENASFAAAVNQGLSMATGNILVILNNDTITTPGWLCRLTRHLQDPQVGLVGPVTNRAPNESEIDVSYRTYGELLQFAFNRARLHTDQVTDIAVAMMFCVAMRRDVLERIGLLDERYAVGMFEDDDYSLRARAEGLRVVCAEDVLVHHFGGASFGKLVGTGEYADLLEANKRRFEAKWGQAWTPHAHRLSRGWQEQIRGVRALIQRTVPEDAVVLVVNRGDDRLLDLGARTGLPFPCDSRGDYAGHYPAAGKEAIELLEQTQSRGATHFVLPSMELWWLEHYGRFREHLESRHIEVARTSAGVVYLLRTPEPR